MSTAAGSGGDTTRVNSPFKDYPVALGFDGAGTYVDLGETPVMNFSGPITIQAWVKPDATHGILNIMAHGFVTGPDAEVYFRIRDGNYEVGSWDGADHRTAYQIPPEDMGSWVHLCGTYDGGAWVLYRNGVQVSRTTSTTGAIAFPGRWAIGARGGGDCRFFQGQMRNVAVWRTARMAREVSRDMYAPTALDDPNLVGYWPLDFGAEAVAADYGPNKLDGTIYDAAWYIPPVGAPNTLVFTGDPLNGYVDLGNPQKLNFAGQITIMGWVYPTAADGIRNMLAHGYTRNPDAEVYFRIFGGHYQAGSWDGGGDHYVDYAMPAGDVSQWVHLAATFNGTAWTMYRNGEQVARRESATGAIPVNAPWVMGARGTGTERFYRGYLRQMSIWNTALTGEMIHHYIHEPPAGDESGLLALWPLGEGDGPRVFDASADPADGILTNSRWVEAPPPPGWFVATREAKFKPMNLPVVLNYGKQLWAMAGQYQDNVYTSADGAVWELVNGDAPWLGRREAAGVVYKGRMWLMGGDCDGRAANDVWWSTDGVEWQSATPGAAWSPRMGLCAVVFRGSIWVFGGSDFAGHIFNDVWRSNDGAQWTRVTENAPWSPRDRAGAAMFKESIWVVGGSYAGNSIQEVWSTPDGVQWIQAQRPPWPSRFHPGVAVLSDKLYITGGTNSNTRGLSDLWVTADANSWTQINDDAPWGPRELQGTALFQGRLYLMGGIASRQNELKDEDSVWYYVPQV